MGRIAGALQRKTQYSDDRYNVNPIQLSAQQLLDESNRAYTSATYGINSGNANIDRSVKSQLFSERLMNDQKAIRGYDEAQSKLNLDVASRNVQGRQTVDQINEAAAARKYQGIDAALGSIGTMGQIVQDQMNTQLKNNISQATLNALSKHYGINSVALIRLMNKDPKAFTQMLVAYKGEQ